MGIAGFVVFGLLAGLLAHLALPRRRTGSAGVTAVVGMGGSLVGGLTGSFLAAEGLQLGPAGLLGAVVGVVFALIGATRGGRPTGNGVHHA